MNQMNREKARLLLDLPTVFDESLLRKKYKIACLKYHPDKCHTDTSKFLEMKDAYDYLYQELNVELDLKESNIDDDILNHFDSDTLKYYVSILNFFKQNIDSIINPVIDHLKKFEYYEIHPTLDQLFNKSLYLLNDTYIPLWHHDLTIEHYKIKIIPDLPDYIDIDSDNNIHVYLSTQSNNSNQLNQSKTFILCGISFSINENKIFKECGIPIIQEKIYDISHLSDVIFHITIN
jgi:hypothetical protein